MADDLWFKRKAYGWGWVPATWQGWAVVLCYAAGLTAVIVLFPPQASVVRWLTFGTAVGGLTGMLVGVCSAKSERPEWEKRLPNQSDEQQRSDQADDARA